MEEITLKNHYDLEVGIFEFVSNAQVNNFNCTNEDKYVASIPKQQSKGCITINEVKSAVIANLIVDKKKSYDY